MLFRSLRRPHLELEQARARQAPSPYLSIPTVPAPSIDSLRGLGNYSSCLVRDQGSNRPGSKAGSSAWVRFPILVHILFKASHISRKWQKDYQFRIFGPTSRVLGPSRRHGGGASRIALRATMRSAMRESDHSLSGPPKTLSTSTLITLTAGTVPIFPRTRATSEERTI